VFGGEVDGNPVNNVYVIDLGNGSVAESTKLERPLSHAAAFVVDGGMFIAGGKTDKGLTDYIWRYVADATPPTNLFAGTLPRPISDAAAVTVGSKVFLAGGESPSFVQEVVQLSPLNDDSGLLAQLTGPTTSNNGSPLPQQTVAPRAIAQPAPTTTRPPTTTRATTTAPPPAPTAAPTTAPATTAPPPTTPPTTQPPATTAAPMTVLHNH
jgi:hypothetical protein